MGEMGKNPVSSWDYMLIYRYRVCVFKDFHATTGTSKSQMELAFQTLQLCKCLFHQKKRSAKFHHKCLLYTTIFHNKSLPLKMKNAPLREDGTEKILQYKAIFIVYFCKSSWSRNSAWSLSSFWSALCWTLNLLEDDDYYSEYLLILLYLNHT